jgi:hypothetical protein
MRSVLEYLAATDEVGLVRCGQSNAGPHGDRDTEGFVAAPHLALRAAGLDLTIASIAPASAAPHGAVGTQSIVSVAEELVRDDWIGGELRLVQHEYGEAVTSSARRGHARVLANAAIASTSTDVAAGGVMAINTTTDVITWFAHGRRNGSQVVFSTTGTLPGLTAGQPYFVVAATEHTFQVAELPNGVAVNLSGGSGTHTVTARACLIVEWQSAFLQASAATFAIGTPGVVTQTGHNLTEGSAVSFTGSLPPELASGQQYFVRSPTANTYQVSTSLGVTALAFTGAGGAATATPTMLATVSGYVHLHDRWTSYDNVHVVTPYQPIEPGDYPLGVPVVPGVTLASDVLSYADAALCLPFAWNEGVEGLGAVGTVTVSSLVCTLQGGQTIADNLFAGGFLRVGGARGKIASNTTTTITVESWTPTAGPGAGTLPYELHLPHWRNNPHHFVAGEGFLYPSGHMQPGGGLPTSTGMTYSRPRGRLVGSYVSRAIGVAVCGAAINATKFARLTTTGSGQVSASIVGGKLRLSRSSTGNDPATGLIQFEHFLRPGYTVELKGLGLTPSVDGLWRVAAVVPVSSGNGSFIDLDPLDATLVATPGSVSGTVPTAATVTRFVWRPVHRFGSLIECAWRLAVAIGRRVVVAHLGVNAAGQILRAANNVTGFQGRLGWWDDNEALDWTPSNDDGVAARLRRLVEFIAPRAVRASYGATRTWKVLGIDVWQGETDAQSVAGRQLAARSMPTFASWLRGLIGAAGLSPYPSSARVPLQWAAITTNPWQIAGLGGDVDGLVNAAIARTVALDGFAASVATETAPKLLNDPLHFSGIGEVQNGQGAADALLRLIDFAFQFRLGPGAIAVANQALSLIGETSNVTSLEPPNATQQARLCSQFLAEARDAVLQLHPWTFATRRVAAVAVDDVVSTWSYAYAVPADMLHPVAVLDPQAGDDLQVLGAQATDPYTGRSLSSFRKPASQPFRIETDQVGNRLLRTNQVDAVFVYIARNVDADVWDPLVRQAWAYRLAYHLSGGTLKGKTGAAVAQSMLQTSLALVGQAAATNAQFQKDQPVQPGCPWLP